MFFNNVLVSLLGNLPFVTISGHKEKDRMYGMKSVQEFIMNSDKSFSKIEQRNVTGNRNENIWKFGMTKTERT